MAKKRPVEQYYTSYNIGNFELDEKATKIVFSTNLNGVSNLYEMALPETYPFQFSNKNQSAGDIVIDKEARFVLTTFDNDGDENYQIHKIPYNGGVPEKLFETSETEKHFGPKLSADGKSVIFTSSKDNENFLNTYRYYFGDGKTETILTGENYPTYFADTDQNNECFAFVKMRSNTNSRGYVLRDGNLELITPDDDIVHMTSNIKIATNDVVYFVTDFKSDFAYLASYDLKTKSFNEELVFESETIDKLFYDKYNHILYIVSVKGVSHDFYKYDLTSGEIEVLEKPLDIIHFVKIVENGDLYVLGTSSQVPNNIYHYDGEWKQLTKNKILGVDKKELVAPEVVKYKSFDDLEIEALLYRAHEEVANGYTLLIPHGGPQAADMKFFSAMYQAFLSRGYNIFSPNFRGSTGYGTKFVKMVEGDWGHGPRLDNVAGVEWLIEQGITDKDHLFVLGGSYGGYMALLLHGRHADMFKAVVDVFGVSNLFTLFDSVPEHWKPMMVEWVGDPEKNKEKFEEDSPINYVEAMTKPMIIIQGVKDPRVVKAESDQVVDQLKSLGREVEYVVLEDEGHGFSKKENEIYVYEKILAFLERHQD